MSRPEDHCHDRKNREELLSRSIGYEKRKLELSSIFDWYSVDFGEDIRKEIKKIELQPKQMKSMLQ